MTVHYKPANDAAATFVRRHIGPSPRDISAMLETVGGKVPLPQDMSHLLAERDNA